MYVYDDNRKITQVKSMDNKDKPQFNYVYTYDGNGNETSRTTLDKNDKQVQKISYTYDTKGNVTEMVEHDAQGALLGRKLINIMKKIKR